MLVVLVAVLALVVGVFVLKDSVLGSSSTSSSGAPPADEDQQSPAPTAPGSSGATSSPSSTPTAGSAPTVNRAARVHVWNGTSRSGLAAGAAQKLSSKGWHATSAGNRSGYAGRTTVYYPRAALRPTAKAVAAALGGAPVRLSTAYGSSGVIVVLGSDYRP